MKSASSGKGGSRRSKQVDLEEAIADKGGARIGHNKPAELTNDEKQALHYRHCTDYETKLAAKKKVEAEFKNACKVIKSEGDSVARIKMTLRARTPEGEDALKAEMQDIADTLRWSGTSVGDTKDLFPVDRTPAIERAFAEGKRAGMDGQPCSPPYDPSVPQYKAWMDGWSEGQSVLASAFGKKPADPDPVTTLIPAADVSDVPFAAGDEVRTTSGEDVTQH